MKRPFFLSMFIIVCLCSSAQKQKPFSISHLRGDFYVYTTSQDIDSNPFPANGMFIVTAKGIVMIDSPWDTTQAIPILDSIEKMYHKKVIAAIATHFHNDRTGSFDIFRSRGIKTYSSCQTLQLCIDRKEPKAQYCFSADTIFDFGDHAIQTFYPGPGHAPDNIVLWFPDAQILFGGCFIKSCDAGDIGNIGDGNLNEYPQSIARVKAHFPHPVFIIPGHQSWNCLRSLDHSLDLVRAKAAE
jgi:glyoxylase-like metal-dependent hydrolase (beta-lactamase superfamily II)